MGSNDKVEGQTEEGVCAFEMSKAGVGQILKLYLE